MRLAATARGRARPAVIAVTGVCAIVAAAIAPARQRLRHLDHVSYLETVRFMNEGAGFYDAFARGRLEAGLTGVDQFRVFRQPLLFELWAAVPDDWLQPMFFVVVVFGGATVATFIVRRPMAGLVVGLYLAVAGVFGGVDAWLLSELWAVPFVLASCAAWLRRRDGSAAALGAAAVIIREPAVFLLIGFGIAARVERRPLRPWLAALGASAVALAAHWWMARPHLEPSVDSAALLQTGSISAVADMTSFIVFPDIVGLALWALGVVLIARSALWPTLGLALLPLLGVVIDRPYWGFLTMPLCIAALGGFPGIDPAPTASSDDDVPNGAAISTP